VNETVAANTFSDDIDDQGVFSSTNVNTANNYGYDGEGRLIRDDAEEIASIKWTVTGKVKEVNRTNGSTKKNLKFRYDAMGQRIAKEVYDSQNNWEKTTYYVRDPQGNVMGIYEKKVDAQSQQLSYKVIERDIYGSSRVGMNTLEVELIGATTGGNSSTHVVGKKQYEVSNHLGNVLSVVTDKVLAKDWNVDNVVDYFRGEIVNASDYTPFGVQMDGRKFEVEDYRYLYNGMESEGASQGEEYVYTTEFRQYDCRLGRWFSTDNLFFIQPYYSTYCAMDNNPIVCNDPSGDIVDKGKKWSKERMNNIWHHTWNVVFSKHYRDMYKKRQADPNNVYHLSFSQDKEVPTLQDGGKTTKNSENDYKWEYTAGFVIKMDGTPPPNQQVCSDDCVPPLDDEFSKESTQGSRRGFFGLSFPKSTEAVYRVTPDAQITFYPLKYNDRLRLYSGGKKIYDSRWVQKKPLKDSNGNIVRDDHGDPVYINDPVTVMLQQYFDSGQIKCNTIKVRVTSGPDKRTIWRFKISSAGNCPAGQQ
jgi:RHS repeat-associated protein